MSEIIYLRPSYPLPLAEEPRKRPFPSEPSDWAGPSSWRGREPLHDYEEGESAPAWLNWAILAALVFCAFLTTLGGIVFAQWCAGKVADGLHLITGAL